MIDAFLFSLSQIITSGGKFIPLICLLAGVVTSFSPCCLSSIPLIIGFVKGTGVNSTKRAFSLSVVFALGSAVTFITFGALAGFAGRFMGSGNRYFYIAMGILMILMALQTWEVYSFIPAANLVSKNTRRGFAGAFIAGILGGVFSTACATPVLVLLLSMAAKSADVLNGVFYLFMFALGHSFLAIAAGTSTGFASKISKNKNYGKLSFAIKIIMGLIMLALGLHLIYHAI